MLVCDIEIEVHSLVSSILHGMTTGEEVCRKIKGVAGREASQSGA